MAHLSFVLPAMVPDDIVAVTSIGVPVSPGEVIPASWLVSVFLAQAIKWPPSVRHFYSFLREHGNATAENFVDAFHGAAKWSSGRKWSTMFARMNSGLQDAQTGLAVNGCQLGLLKSDFVKRRSTGKAGEALLRLGPISTEYAMAVAGDPGMEAALHICRFMLSSAESMKLRWPAETADVKAFVCSLFEWAKSMRSTSHKGLVWTVAVARGISTK